MLDCDVLWQFGLILFLLFFSIISLRKLVSTFKKLEQIGNKEEIEKFVDDYASISVIMAMVIFGSVLLLIFMATTILFC